MKNNNFTINYPSIFCGTEKSHISFLSGKPDLVSVFNPGQNPENKRRFFVTDATVASLDCMKDFISKFDDDSCGKDVLMILGSGEPYKTIDSVLRIIKKAIDEGFSRNDVFVGIGGGVICDLTSFAASIFKRGASVQFVPTTLLAMIDASIGGKTGCDFENYKNMIGSFFPATDLFYFPEFVQYLPEKQYFSGLGEAFKTALLCDEELVCLFKNESEKIKNRDVEIVDIIIKKCVAAKAQIVEQDFTEKNIRAFLNFGHSFGHALETIVGLGSITHGEAVAWGIGRAIHLSYKKDFCSEAFRNSVFEILQNFGWETKAVPSIVKGGGIGERFLTAMHKDKKNIDDKIRLVLQKNIKDTFIAEVDDTDILNVLK